MIVENTESLIAGLPKEIWAMVFCSIYFDKDAINNCKDIFEALNYLKTDFKEKLSLCSKNISGACKAFDCVNKNLQSIQELKEFCRSLLAERFLEFRDDGLYPKDGTWGLNYDIDKQIAKFLATRNEGNCSILKNIMNFTFKYKRYNKNSNLIEKVIALLLFYNASVNGRNEKGYTILHEAIWLHCDDCNMEEIIKILLAYVDVDIKDGDGKTALFFALFFDIKSNMSEIIKILLTHNANVNIQTETGLLEDVVNRHNRYGEDMREIAELLLAHGANVNLLTKYGNTVLHQAVYNDENNNMKDMIEVLLAHGADVNIKDKFGYTAVDKAKGDVKELLKNSESYLNRQQFCLLS